MHAVLQQKNKSFEPHLLVVTKGSSVDFPNRDPWFHNVFSLFNGKRFDLGLYEAGTSRTVHFDREGVSYIFCNIHPEMSAVVVVLSSPYFAIPNKQGDFSIAAVPPGRYILHVWNENALPATLQALSREVTVSETLILVGVDPRAGDSGHGCESTRTSTDRTTSHPLRTIRFTCSRDLQVRQRFVSVGIGPST